MANSQRGEVGHTVEGQVYRLKPTFNAFCEIEDLVGGMNIDDVMAGLVEGRLSGLRAVTWCLLQEYHAPEIRTLKDAGTWIERAGGAEAVLALVNRALTSNVEGDGKTDPPTAQDGIGARSTSEPAVPA